MTIEVGVADGDWRSSITFDRHTNQNNFNKSEHRASGEVWEGTVRVAKAQGDTVPLSFSYSRRDDYETRLAYEKSDGTIVPMVGEGSDSSHGLHHGVMSLPITEFESIKQFHVQSRRYQWVEFRHVSLELGHRTTVEVR